MKRDHSITYLPRDERSETRLAAAPFSPSTSSVKSGHFLRYRGRVVSKTATNFLDAPIRPPLTLCRGRGSGLTRTQNRELGWCARKARRRLLCMVPQGFRPGSEIDSTPRADRWVPESDPPFVRAFIESHSRKHRTFPTRRQSPDWY